MEFIFMLTHHDVTIPSALEVLEEVKDTGLRCVGCKDIGLSLDKYRELFARFRKYGLQSFLEVVTYSEEKHFRAVDLALKIGTDNIIGGMPPYTKKTVEYLKQKRTDTKYFPYIGKVTGHPCILGGKVEEIIAEGKEAERQGINGINLLLYRYTENQEKLLKSLKELRVPLIVAGNVANSGQIKQLREYGLWAFTIGGAVFEKKFVETGSTESQIQTVLKQL